MHHFVCFVEQFCFMALSGKYMSDRVEAKGMHTRAGQLSEAKNRGINMKKTNVIKTIFSLVTC